MFQVSIKDELESKIRKELYNAGFIEYTSAQRIGYEVKVMPTYIAIRFHHVTTGKETNDTHYAMHTLDQHGIYALRRWNTLIVRI